MAVEVEANTFCKKKLEYPYLGKHKDGLIVLFVELYNGTVLFSNGSVNPNEKEGAYSEGWREDDFTPLSPSESITLRNV